LHKKGAVIVNNYKTVRIRNINKTVIVRDYKPLLTAERKRARKGIVAKSAWGRNFDRRRPSVQPERRVVKAGKTARHQRAARRDDRVIKGHANATEKKRENSRAEKIQKKAVRPAQRTGERQIEKQEKPLPKSSIAERISVQRKQAIRRDRNKAGAEEPRPAEVESRRRSKVVQEKATVIRKGDRGERTLARKEAQQPQRQVARHEDRAQKASLKNIGKHTEKQERKEYKTERQISRNQNSFREKNVSPKRNTDRQKPGRGWISASMNNRRMR
jgi:hypothetical protein